MRRGLSVTMLSTPQPRNVRARAGSFTVKVTRP